MKLIDKDDHIVVSVDLLDQALQTILKLTSIFRSRHHRPQVNLQQALALQEIRHLATGNLLS